MVDDFDVEDVEVELAAGALVELGVLDDSFLLGIFDVSILLGVLGAMAESALRESVR
ncbi:hypothetical protein GALL_463600 [mine drainage metagenome]|uniref:Uncharacterized protein n=1 Tax=mine drainage metagenome TaxID=410659 RepID=A0A1J5Q3I0_9ZZZZ